MAKAKGMPSPTHPHAPRLPALDLLARDGGRPQHGSPHRRHHHRRGHLRPQRPRQYVVDGILGRDYIPVQGGWWSSPWATCSSTSPSTCSTPSSTQGSAMPARSPDPSIRTPAPGRLALRQSGDLATEITGSPTATSRSSRRPCTSSTPTRSAPTMSSRSAWAPSSGRPLPGSVWSPWWRAAGARPAPRRLPQPEPVCAVRTPSADHWFGTDTAGSRHLLRVIWGARVSLSSASPPSPSGLIIGGFMGLVAGYFKGRSRAGLMAPDGRAAGLPRPAAGPGHRDLPRRPEPSPNVMLAIGIVAIPTIARLVRANTARGAPTSRPTSAPSWASSAPSTACRSPSTGARRSASWASPARARRCCRARS
jgi:hypothetical protein